MHLTEDFPISSRLIRKTFRDEQKMNPNSAWNIWKLLARTRPEPDPNPNPTRKTRPDSNCELNVHNMTQLVVTQVTKEFRG